MALLLLVCVAGYYARRLLGGPNRWPRRFLGGIARLAGARVRVVGTVPANGAVLLANHVSWIDICALAGATGSAFVAHDGLAQVSPLRWLCEMNDTVFIARQRRTTVAEQVEQVRRAIHASPALTLFPEGTTSNGSELLPFKSSLLSALESLPAGIRAHPVLLDYGPEAPAIAWVGDEPGVNNFKRIVARREPIELTIHLLPPLSEKEVADRKLAASTAREALASTLSQARAAAVRSVASGHPGA